MDWPTRSIRSRITWLLLGLKPRRRPQTSVHPAGETLPATGASAPRYAIPVEEHLYSIERPGGRPPLLLLTAIDGEGRLARVITCDGENYQ